MPRSPALRCRRRRRTRWKTPLRVEGTIRQPAADGAAEYSVVLSIRNERGEEITRQVVGVGAMKPDETRTFTLAVEMFAAPNKGRRAR